jgi:hypothetical protein
LAKSRHPHGNAIDPTAHHGEDVAPPSCCDFGDPKPDSACRTRQGRKISLIFTTLADDLIRTIHLFRSNRLRLSRAGEARAPAWKRVDEMQGVAG